MDSPTTASGVARAMALLIGGDCFPRIARRGSPNIAVRAAFCSQPKAALYSQPTGDNHAQSSFDCGRCGRAIDVGCGPAGRYDRSAADRAANAAARFGTGAGGLSDFAAAAEREPDTRDTA